MCVCIYFIYATNPAFDSVPANHSHFLFRATYDARIYRVFCPDVWKIENDIQHSFIILKIAWRNLEKFLFFIVGKNLWLIMFNLEIVRFIKIYLWRCLEIRNSLVWIKKEMESIWIFAQFLNKPYFEIKFLFKNRRIKVSILSKRKSSLEKAEVFLRKSSI